MAKLCKTCAKTKSRKVEWPTKETLEKEVWSCSATKLAQRYGVSDNAISKWCEIYGIEKPPRGYWRKRDLGYSHEESLVFGVKKISDIEVENNIKRENVLREIKNGNESMLDIALKAKVDSGTVHRIIAKYYGLMALKLGIRI